MTAAPGPAIAEGRVSPLPVYAAGFVTAFGAHAVAANLAAYAVSRHSSLWELGLLLGVYDAAEVLLKPVFGSVVDRHGAKPVMVGGLVAFALASAAFSPAAGAAIAGLGGKKRTGRLFGGYGGAKGVGYLLGPVAGGALVVGGGYRLLFAVVGAVALGAAVWVAARVPHIVPARRPRSTLAALIAQVRHPDFLRPVILLAAETAALSAGVGFLPLLGARHHLSPLATGALVSLLAATAAVVQPWVGRRHDRNGLPVDAPTVALTVAAGGFVVAVLVPNAAGIAVAAILIGIGVAVVTPLGFAELAASAPPDRLGRTMGAGEVGRELGDAGGPVLVGAFGPVGLGAGIAVLAGALAVCAGLVSPRLTHRHTKSPAVAPGESEDT